jgi:hypothetical protein
MTRLSKMESLAKEFYWLEQLFRDSYIDKLIHYEVVDQLNDCPVVGGDFMVGQLILDDIWILK